MTLMKHHGLFNAAVCAFLAFTVTGNANAKPWIVQADGIEINWSNLTARFDGVAASDVAKQDGLKDLERTAWRNGYERAVPVLDRVLRDQHAKTGTPVNESDGGLAKARSEVVKSVQSLNATFFASGAVEVSMEAKLRDGFAHALRKAGAGHAGTGGTSGGLVLRLPKGVDPAIAFWLVDSSGKVLFEPRKGSAAAVAQGAMGRWFRNADKSELSAIIGNSHESLNVDGVREGNRLIIDGERFAALRDETLKALADGRVALISQ